MTFVMHFYFVLINISLEYKLVTAILILPFIQQIDNYKQH